PPVVSSRYLTKSSKSGPLQASVASALSGATEPMDAIVRPGGGSAKGGSEAVVAQRRVAVVVRAPAEDLAFAQLEAPGHLIDAGERIVLRPAPSPSDQRHGLPSAPLEPFLVELLELDRLLHATWLPRRPNPRPLAPLAQTAGSVQLNLGI